MRVRSIQFAVTLVYLIGAGVALSAPPTLPPKAIPQFSFEPEVAEPYKLTRLPLQDTDASFFQFSRVEEVFTAKPSAKSTDVIEQWPRQSQGSQPMASADEMERLSLTASNLDPPREGLTIAAPREDRGSAHEVQFPFPNPIESAYKLPPNTSQSREVLARQSDEVVPLPGEDESIAPEDLPDPTLPDEVFAPAIEEQTSLSARLGWWSVRPKGSPVKTGEYQSLNDSPFLDVDGLMTNGVRTWDFHLTNLDDDARSVAVNWYSPLLQADVAYDSYLRRLDRDPLDFYVDFDQQPARPLPGPPANFRDMKEDLAVGEDFAIRVQELESSFQGKATEHFTWRLNVWGMRKSGERQANALAHCFTAQNAVDTNGNPAPGPACHQLSQRQRIDWLTAEIEPVLQAKFGGVSAEYARTMRTLITDDQIVTRPYDNFGFSGDQPYALVPENYTFIDRLKLGAALSENRNVYARLYNGNTNNEFRDTNRRFSGLDVRLTDQSVDGVSVTGYAKKYLQSGQVPSSLLPFESVNNLRIPIGYDRTMLGTTASWQPFVGEYSPRSHWRLTGGYEYRELERENAIFEESALTVDQRSTLSNQVHLRASTKVTTDWSSFSGYRLTFVDSPLFGVPIANTSTNTSLPTQAHRVEFGNTWTPSHTFMLHNLLSFHNGQNRSDIAQFDADNYDVVLSYWYAPAPAWSFSGGLGLYSNWIDQEITLGSKIDPFTEVWEYGGRSSVVNLGTTYVWTKQTTLSGNIDLVRGHNSFDPLADYTDLPALSDVIVETTRFTLGVDHTLGPHSSAYVRYQLMDYDDKSDSLVGGSVKMLLVGLNAWF